MAEPFLLRPWEIERLTDGQIKAMIAGQKRATDAIAKQSSQSEIPKDFESGEAEVTDKGYVTPAEAKEYMRTMEERIYGVDD